MIIHVENYIKLTLEVKGNGSIRDKNETRGFLNSDNKVMTVATQPRQPFFFLLKSKKAASE